MNPKDDGIDELIAALNDATSLQTKSTNDKKDSGISEAFSISPNQINPTKTIDLKTDNDTTEQPTEAKKQQQQLKGHTPVRKRTPSSCSNKSIDSNKLKNTSKLQQPNKNIVKKTIAKVTAAFKTNKIATCENNTQLKLKTKSSNQSRDKTKKPDGPLKVEYTKSVQEPVEQVFDLENLEAHETTTSSSGNRRCSSVPRTLKEKQALNKQITLGEKIHNFFSRDTHKSGIKSRIYN
jgi:hypothetical protein